MSFPTTQNFGVSIPKNIQAAGNTYGPQAFGSGFNASKIPGLAFNSNVKVSSGLPSISRPQDYSSKGTKVSTKDVVKSINKASDQQIAKSVGGMITRDGSVLTYDIATGIGISSVGDVRKGLKDNASSIKNDIDKDFKTDKMTKNVGNVADVDNNSNIYPGRRVSGGGRDPEYSRGSKGLLPPIQRTDTWKQFDLINNGRGSAGKANKDTTSFKPQGPEGGPNLRSTWPGRRVGAGTRLMAPATTPTAVAVAKSAPAAAPASKPVSAPPTKAAATQKAIAPATTPTAAAIAKAISPNAPAPKPAAAPAKAATPAPSAKPTAAAIAKAISPNAPAPKPAPSPPAKPSGGGNKGGGGKKK